jgi:hypothetical protein
MYDFARHAFRADAKVMQRALRLGSPQSVRRNFQFPERVTFNACFRGSIASFGHMTWSVVRASRRNYAE